MHLGAEPAVGGGDLGARRARADHGDRLGQLDSSAHASSVPMTRPPNSVPGSGLGTEPVARMTALRLDLGAVEVAADLDVAVVGDRAEALDEVDLVLLEQARDAAGQRLDDLLRGARMTLPKSTRARRRRRCRSRRPRRSR